MSTDAALLQLKITTAVAILRRKPAGVNARQYTEQLCAKYQQSQTQWRSRYLQAQDALIYLKQQQAVLAIQSAESCPPTPPSSAPESGNNSSQAFPPVTSQQILLSSYQFIHAVIHLSGALQTYSTNKSDSQRESALDKYSSTHPSAASIDSLFSKTVPACVKHIRVLIDRGDSEVSTSCILQGLDGLLLLLSSTWVRDSEQQEHFLLSQLGELVDDLLQRLFEPASDDIIQCVQSRRLLHQMLLHLTVKMRVPEKYMVLQTLSNNAKILCQIISQPSVENPSCYERLAIALDCLQQGTASLTVEDLHVESLKELQNEVESILDSKLAQRFPLVANTIWRLISMIELCRKSNR